MLALLEVDGFKNLLGFSATFGPFTCIAGDNGVGKSNIFDSIEFLALIADRSLAEAAQEVRSSRRDGAGEPQHLFTLGLDRRPIRMAAEMVVPGSVEDDFGTRVKPSITFVRYEVQIGLDPAERPARHGRLVVEHESLRHINRGDAARHLGFPHSAKDFRSSIVTGERRGGPFISTEQGNGRITVHQDGGSRGRPRRQLPTRAATTVLSTINTADDPTILAVRREMQSWRRLALEPTALRASDRFTDPATMASNGRHLAAVLHRVAHSAAQGSTPDDVYARIGSRLSGLAGLDVRKLWVDVDEVRDLYTVMVEDGDGRSLPARSLSEGTLRYLALCVIQEDPQMTGLITMEEPENGIHPANLGEMVELVRDLAVDAHLPPGPDNPLRQVIVNTHSPAIVQLVGAEDLLMASEHPVALDGLTVPALRVDGIQGSWRAPAGHGVTRASLLPYVSTPPGAQLVIPGVA